MTTQDKTPIRALIEAVECGQISTDLIMEAFGNLWDDMLVLAAYDGSLDAAKELHEALLPGWTPGLQMQDGGSWFCELREGYCTSFNLVRIATADKPARAWLLAILRAYEAHQ